MAIKNGVILQSENEDEVLGANFAIYDKNGDDISLKEVTANKVTTIDTSSTDTQYPSALAVKTYVDTSSGGGLDTEVKLSADLYTYGKIGVAQYATDGVITDSGTEISYTNPGKVASAGQSLKKVFNVIFGEPKDAEPKITVSRSLSVSQDSAYAGGEYGTSISETFVYITFTLANTATAQYGYRVGTAKTTGSRSVVYPIVKQSNAELQITLPSNKTATTDMVTAGTAVSVSSNVLYANFNSNKKVTIKITLPDGEIGENEADRYGTITGLVQLGGAQNSSGSTITAFLTYLGNDAADQTALYTTTTNFSNTTNKYTFSAGSFYLYRSTGTSSSSSPTKDTSLTSGTTISYSKDVYIYVYSKNNSYSNIQTDATGSGGWTNLSDGTTLESNKKTITLSTNKPYDYFVYRSTGTTAAAGSGKFRIN